MFTIIRHLYLRVHKLVICNLHYSSYLLDNFRLRVRFLHINAILWRIKFVSALKLRHIMMFL